LGLFESGERPIPGEDIDARLAEEAELRGFGFGCDERGDGLVGQFPRGGDAGDLEVRGGERNVGIEAAAAGGERSAGVSWPSFLRRTSCRKPRSFMP